MSARDYDGLATTLPHGLVENDMLVVITRVSSFTGNEIGKDEIGQLRDCSLT